MTSRRDWYERRSHQGEEKGLQNPHRGFDSHRRLLRERLSTVSYQFRFGGLKTHD